MKPLRAAPTGPQSYLSGGPPCLTVVVADDTALFRKWCYDNGYNPRDKRIVRVVDGEWERIRGLEGEQRGANAKLVLLGDYAALRSWPQIRSILESQGFLARPTRNPQGEP